MVNASIMSSHLTFISVTLFYRPMPRERITIWNNKKKSKTFGMNAPMRKNLEEYLRTHPQCEVYTDQDKDMVETLCVHVCVRTRRFT